MDKHIQQTRRSTMGLPERATETAVAQEAGRQDRARRGGMRMLPEHIKVYGRSSVHKKTHGQRAHRQHLRVPTQECNFFYSKRVFFNIFRN